MTTTKRQRRKRRLTIRRGGIINDDRLLFGSLTPSLLESASVFCFLLQTVHTFIKSKIRL